MGHGDEGYYDDISDDEKEIEEEEEEEEEVPALECVFDLLSTRPCDDLQDLIFGAMSMPPVEMIEEMYIICEKLLDFTQEDYPDDEDSRLRGETVVNLLQVNCARCPQIKNENFDSIIGALEEWCPYIKTGNHSEITQPHVDLALAFLMIIGNIDDTRDVKETIEIFEKYLQKDIPSIDKCICTATRNIVSLYDGTEDGAECIALVDAMITEGRPVFYPVIEFVFESLPVVAGGRLASIYNLYSLASDDDSKMNFLMMLHSATKKNPFDMLQFVDSLREDIPLNDGFFANEILQIFKLIVYDDMEFIFDCKDDMLAAIQMNSACKGTVRSILNMLDWQNQELLDATADVED